MEKEKVPQSTKRSIEAERRRGEGKNAGRKVGRPKAVNQGGEISPKNPEPMTLHSPTENSLAVLNHKVLEANSQVQNVKLGGHQTCLSINRLWHELCDMLRRLVGTTAPGHHDCSIPE
ncbi:uncharacterized protein TNCV_1015781 [Trichonephila clavipes]|uniref:Uncharacterized protein n=1 Tax=Trichonephila clavipes TaxID=2585209 RepID=A0A8X6VXS0_TRICX|nr:uncharacterized protein TNCV_1015781 [Trichonephila clavipes]